MSDCITFTLCYILREYLEYIVDRLYASTVPFYIWELRLLLWDCRNPGTNPLWILKDGCTDCSQEEVSTAASVQQSPGREVTPHSLLAIGKECMGSPPGLLYTLHLVQCV